MLAWCSMSIDLARSTVSRWLPYTVSRVTAVEGASWPPNSCRTSTCTHQTFAATACRSDTALDPRAARGRCARPYAAQRLRSRHHHGALVGRHCRGTCCSECPGAGGPSDTARPRHRAAAGRRRTAGVRRARRTRVRQPGASGTRARAVLTDRGAPARRRRGDDGRWRWRYSVPVAVASYSELAAGSYATSLRARAILCRTQFTQRADMRCADGKRDFSP